MFVLQLEEDELRGVALLVFANKQDLPRAMSVSDITEALGLTGISQPVGVHDVYTSPKIQAPFYKRVSEISMYRINC